MYAIIVIHAFVIDIKLFVFAFDDIAGHPHHSLDKIFLGVHRILKYNDVPPLGRFNGKDRFLPIRKLNPVNKFINQDMIADLKRLLHGTRWYFKGLHHKCAYKQGNQNSHEDGFNIFSKMAFLGRLFNNFR